jgi:hypothetical protein
MRRPLGIGTVSRISVDDDPEFHARRVQTSSPLHQLRLPAIQPDDVSLEERDLLARLLVKDSRKLQHTVQAGS